MAGIDILSLIIVFGVIFLSMTVHEVMHGLVAYRLGDDTAKLQGRLTLNPLKHIDPFLTLLLPLLLFLAGGPIFGGAKPVPFRPDKVRFGDWGSAMVALAGPLTNLLIAFVFFGVGVVFNPVAGSIIGSIVSYGVVVNLGFFVFNMIPFPPLDGSRFLYAVAPEPARQIMDVIERYGIFVVMIIVVFANAAIGTYMSSAIGAIIELFNHIYLR